MAARKHRRRRRRNIRRIFSNPSGRRRRRLGGSRRRSGGGTSTIKGLFSKDNLTLAAGVVGAGVVTTVVLSKFGSQLPGLVKEDGTTNTTIATLYAGAIPFGAAALFRMANMPRVATGVAIGGLIAVVNSLTRPIQQQLVASLTSTSSASGTGALPGLVPSSRRIGEYFPTRGIRGPAGYSAMTAFGASPYQNSSAFAGSAW